VRDDDRHGDPAGAAEGEGDEGRPSIDVPEWVSEFRRLYVEPKTRSGLREELKKSARRASGASSAPAAAAGIRPAAGDRLGGPDPEGVSPEGAPVVPPHPLSDEPLRSRSELHRDRRAAPPSRTTRHDPTTAMPSRAADADPDLGSRAAMRQQRAERARMERRMRLRRTVVVGVLLLVVAAVVTWVVTRNHQPVSASASAAALVLQDLASAPASTPTPGTGTVDAGSAARRADTAVTGGSRPVAVRASARPTVAAVTPPPRPTATPAPAPVARGTGKLSWVDWGEVDGLRTTGGRVVRVALQAEGGVGLDRSRTAHEIADILVDPRGWQTERDVRFVFVDADRARAGAYDLRIALASRTTTMDLCGPVQTKGFTSCYNGLVVINLDRWMLGVDAYAGHLEEYRTYVVNHEVGHSFGLGHDGCSQKGDPASVMVPQTLHLYGCLPNPFPVLD
jgi:hypothetical protein